MFTYISGVASIWQVGGHTLSPPTDFWTTFSSKGRVLQNFVLKKGSSFFGHMHSKNSTQR